MLALHGTGRLRRSFALAVVALLTVSVGAAAAGTREVVEKNVDVHREIDGFITCGDTSLDYVVDVRRTITETYADDGSLLRWEANVHYTATLTDPVSGLVIRDDGSRRVLDDFPREQTVVTGGAHHVTWPGGGLVFGEV